MTARQGQLFAKPPRQMRGQLMHVSDAMSDRPKGRPNGCIVQMQCQKCANISEWLEFDTVTEAKRGIPCPECNVQ